MKKRANEKHNAPAGVRTFCCYESKIKSHRKSKEYTEAKRNFATHSDFSVEIKDEVDKSKVLRGI